MSALANLKSAKNLIDFAPLIGYSPSGLAYVLYKYSDAAKYTQFSLPKKSGGTRTISAPVGALRGIQEQLSALLYQCRDEAEASFKGRHLSHAFRRGYSIITNAQVHERSRYVLNIDIANFFDSINFGRVRGFFLKNKTFALEEKVATIIAQICSFKNALPQGAPTSPIVSDFVGRILDYRILKVTSKYGARYTRYVDDLTISYNGKNFPTEIAEINPDTGNWRVSKAILDIFEKSKFSLNSEKTRMQYRGSQQTVTGLCVNEKTNITQHKYREARSMVWSLLKSGSYFKFIDPGPPPTPVITNSINKIEGILSHIITVKHAAVERDRKKKSNKEKIGADDVPANALYRRFLFYKNFVALEKPLIICEGKTDSIYLTGAIRALNAIHPLLASPGPDGFDFHVKFFNYRNRAHEYQRITGGSGPLLNLFQSYRRILHSIPHRPLKHPVILLFDNDSGFSQKIILALKKNFLKTIDKTTNDPFYHLTDNLYLIKTPHIGKNQETCIEDFFDSSLTGEIIDGKSFNPSNNNFDASTQYGKEIFAQKVVVPNSATLDWSAFTSLLSGIEQVMVHYAALTKPT